MKEKGAQIGGKLVAKIVKGSMLGNDSLTFREGLSYKKKYVVKVY